MLIVSKTVLRRLHPLELGVPELAGLPEYQDHPGMALNLHPLELGVPELAGLPEYQDHPGMALNRRPGTNTHTTLQGGTRGF